MMKSSSTPQIRVHLVLYVPLAEMKIHCFGGFFFLFLGILINGRCFFLCSFSFVTPLLCFTLLHPYLLRVTWHRVLPYQALLCHLGSSQFKKYPEVTVWISLLCYSTTWQMSDPM